MANENEYQYPWQNPDNKQWACDDHLPNGSLDCKKCTKSKERREEAMRVAIAGHCKLNSEYIQTIVNPIKCT